MKKYRVIAHSKNCRDLLLWCSLALLILLHLSGCAGVGKIRDAPPTEGRALTVAAGYEDTKRAAREAIAYAKYEIVEEKQLDPDSYMVIGLLGVSMQSNGQWGRVIVKRLSDSQTNAWVYTMKRIEMNITENVDITERAVEKYLLQFLDIYKEERKASGQALPQAH